MLFLPKNHPSLVSLSKEGVSVSDFDAPDNTINVIILNLMPQKQEAEEEFYRVLDKCGVDIKIILAKMSGLTYKTTPQAYMDQYYIDIAEIMSTNRHYEGMIITGAPLEHYEYKEVKYWQQLKDVYEWSLLHVRSTLNICWAAFAALKIFYNIDKYLTKEKLFGVFKHEIKDIAQSIVNGFPISVPVPISRQITLRREDIYRHQELILLLDHHETGPELIIDQQKRHIFATGHLEYAANRLEFEYVRDIKKGLPIKLPANYFIDNNPNLGINNSWHEVGELFYKNWIDFYVKE